MVISAKTVIRLLGTNLSQKVGEEGRSSDQPFYMKLYREKWRLGQDRSVVGRQLLCALSLLLSVTFPRVPAPFRPDPPQEALDWVQQCTLFETSPAEHPRPLLGGGGMEPEPILPPAARGGGHGARPGL